MTAHLVPAPPPLPDAERVRATLTRVGFLLDER